MVFKIFKTVMSQFQTRKVHPIMLGRWNLKRDEKAEYFAASNANKDNCFNNYNNLKQNDYTIEELTIWSHTNSFPKSKK